MKDFFKRLKTHPGLWFAVLFTVLGGLAGMSNKSIESPVHGFLIGAAVIGFIVWGIVFSSNYKQSD